MILLVSLLLAIFQDASIPTGTIEGTVQHLSSNSGIGGIGIRVRSAAGADLQTVSDAAGRFVLRGVPEGRVTVEALGEGYLFSLQTNGAVIPVESQHLLTVNGNAFPGRNPSFAVNVPRGETLKLPAIGLRRPPLFAAESSTARTNLFPRLSVSLPRFRTVRDVARFGWNPARRKPTSAGSFVACSLLALTTLRP